MAWIQALFALVCVALRADESSASSCLIPSAQSDPSAIRRVRAAAANMMLTRLLLFDLLARRLCSSTRWGPLAVSVVLAAPLADLVWRLHLVGVPGRDMSPRVTGDFSISSKIVVGASG